MSAVGEALRATIGIAEDWGFGWGVDDEDHRALARAEGAAYGHAFRAAELAYELGRDGGVSHGRATDRARWTVKRAAEHAKIEALALDPRPTALPDPDGRTVHLVQPNMAQPGWRVTRLDDHGPAGDSTAPTFERVLHIAREYGADVLRAVHVTPATVDAVVSGFGILARAELPPGS